MAVVPVNSNISIKINSFPDSNNRANLPLSNLVRGETFTLNVAEKLSPHHYLMTLKGVSFTATSEVSLKTGDKLQVKVLNVQPQIILSMVDEPTQTSVAKVNEGLLQWRLHPDSLVHLLSKVNEFSTQLKSGDLPVIMSEKDTDVLLKLFKNIILSPQNKNNSLFVKDFVSRLGLLLESNLGRHAAGQANEGGLPVLTDNLKASLLRLSANLAAILKNSSKLDAHVTAKLINLSSFASEALQTIEARQAVNVIYQQNESGLYLQIPLAMGTALSQADIFITPDDKNASETKKYSSCSVMIFLDLDYLGEIEIKASLREGRIRCVIKCESEAVKLLVDASAPKLKEALETVGYGMEQIDCLKVSGLGIKRVEYVEQQILGSTDLVNYFV